MVEDEKKLKRLKAERSQLRRLVTNSSEAIGRLFDVEEAKDVNTIEEKFRVLADRVDRLFKIDDQVREVLLDLDTSEEDLTEEYDTVERYRELWFSLSVKRDRLVEPTSASRIKNEDVSDSSSETSSVASKKPKPQKKKFVKLVRLDPKKYDGSLSNWIGFWSMFKTIDEDMDMDNEQKFQYLIQFTKEGSPARGFLDIFPPSAENYTKALEQFKARFGRPDRLIDMYVRELLKLVLVQATSSGELPLRTLYDRLVTQLQALESLGVAKDNYAYLLLPLVESALPEPVLRLWQRRRSSISSNNDSVLKDGASERGSSKFDVIPQVGRLEELLSFLQEEVEGEEMMSLAKDTFSMKVDAGDKQHERKSPKKEFAKPGKTKGAGQSVPTATGLVNVKESEKPSCIFCSRSHPSESCVKSHDMSADEIMKLLSAHGHCFLCFRKGHSKFKCRAVIKCVICAKKHNSILCESRRVKPAEQVEPSKDGTLNHNLSNVHHCPILLQTLRVILRGKYKDIEARVMIDCGSQKSYITQRVLSHLDYSPTRTESLVHALFGGTTKPQTHKCYKLHLASLDKSYMCNFDVLDTDTICLAVPAPTPGQWLPELTKLGISIADHRDGPIDVLIGADIAGKLWTGRREILTCGLVAVETLLGWTLMGKMTGSAVATCETHITMMCTEASPSDLWRLDILGIEDPAEKSSKEQSLMRVKEDFTKTVKILEGGRYQVNLPWRDDHPPLQRNFELANLRFNKELRKLEAKGRKSDYLNVLLDWLNEGIIEEVPRERWDEGHYLPHRAVYKEGSTTPLRPVFDASAREKGHPSLNQCLEPGPNLIEKIPPLLTRFRKGKIGLVADVKRAFLNIAVIDSERDFMRFIWKDENGLRIFRHCRVVFGVSCSPFLLGAVFEHHLDNCETMIHNGEFDCPQSIIDQLRRSVYVDNYVGSHSDLSEVEDFIHHARSTFSKACFDLRGWERTNPSLPQNTETSLLGIIWDQKNDTLKLKNPVFNDIDENHITKRILASASHRLFDPIGLISPVMVTPKRLFQKVALSGGGWDKLVDEESRAEILKWMAEIPLLSGISIPRWFENYDLEGASVSLHTFCDASQLAYAAVVFLRIELDGDVNVQFVCAKSRIAPPGKVTIPRLELLAAVVGSRLAHGVLEDLVGVHEKVYWSDSSTALCWIQKEEPWAVFVSNRVKEIRKLTNPSSWRHVPGVSNPADLASRGCSSKAFVQSRWWEGPTWLKQPENEWPSSNFIVDEDMVSEERRKTAVLALNAPAKQGSLEFIGHLACYFRVVRVVAWIRRFAANAKKGVRTRQSQETRVSGDLSPFECKMAERSLLKVVQSESFPLSQDDKAIKRLKPHVDSQGLIRLRTKIWARKDSEDFRAPIVLSPDHPMTNLLMRSIHIQNKHIAGHGLLNVLREKYWIIRGKQAVRRIVKECVTCQKVYSKNLDIESPPLPEDRVRDACIFEVIGTDLAGPLYLRDGSKVWLVIFTCAIFRAVHLDLITSQSTEGFILALRRFIARRGRPTLIISDNGTNFRGAANAMQALDWNKIKAHFNAEPIEWRFNPPTGSWWGGFFERLIGLVKILLKKNLGRASLDYAELYTLICECEMQVNARPITYLSDTNDGPVPVSPSMFLQEIRESGVPDLEQIDSTSLQRRLRYRQRIKQELRERFRSEYLSQLICCNGKRKETRQPVVGELVLIGADNKKRLDWPLAVIEELLIGTDGRCRVVKLRTNEGKLIRPIQRIYPLEVFSAEDTRKKSGDLPKREEKTEEDIQPDDDTTTPIPSNDSNSALAETKPPELVKEVTTRCGRKIVLPLKLR